eukprot:IDg3555t1
MIKRPRRAVADEVGRAKEENSNARTYSVAP